MRVQLTGSPCLAALFAGLLLVGAGPAGAAADWLALCSKCVNPGVFSKTGIGTDNALAEARITRAEVQAWCDNWQPGDKSCLPNQLAAEDLKKVYRASANCPAGRITPVDGKTYTLAGAWDNKDIGGGRSRWRDASGQIVGRDNASGGLGISQQWELLCPGGGKGTKTPAAKAPAPAPVKAAEFAVGQTVLARFGREWVRARVNAVRQRNTPQGPEPAYDVTLENGQRGVVPARMLRAR